MLQCGMGVIMCPIAFILTMAKKAIASKQAEFMACFFFFLIKSKIQAISPSLCPSPCACSCWVVPPIPLRQGHSPASCSIVGLWEHPWHWQVLVYTENEKRLFLSFQEYQKNKKTVPSLCGPKAPSALSLSATLVAIVLCLSLRSFSNLFHCCSFRPVGISYNCPSPVTDQDKSSGGATQKTQRGKESQP